MEPKDSQAPMCTNENCEFLSPPFMERKIAKMLGAIGPELAAQARTVICKMGCENCKVSGTLWMDVNTDKK